MKKTKYLILALAIGMISTAVFAFQINNKVEAVVPGGIIPDGTYVIQCLHSGRTVDSTLSGVTGTQILQWGYNGGGNQKWQLEHLGNNQYKITSVFNQKVLDVAGNSMLNEAMIVTWTASGNNNQKFILEERGYNSYAIKSVSSGKYMDVLGPSYINGGLIGQYTGTNGENQTFVFLKQN